jgi:transposase
MTEIKLITSVERRRRWTVEEKRQIVQETYLPGTSISQVARKYDINPSQLFYWRRLMEDGALNSIRSQEELVPKSRVKELEKQVRELERLLGKKTLQIEILQEGIKIAQEKKLISRQPFPGLENLVSEQ